MTLDLPLLTDVLFGVIPIPRVQEPQSRFSGADVWLDYARRVVHRQDDALVPGEVVVWTVEGAGVASMVARELVLTVVLVGHQLAITSNESQL